MKNSPIIYCHYGNSKYLPYIFKGAKISNPNAEIILLGDPSNKQIALDCGLTHYSLKDFDFGQDLETFDQVYELIATKEFDAFKHGEDWNKFVFRKWFIIYNFAAKQGIKRFWHFDSDNMIISNLSELEQKYQEYDCTVQCHGQCFKGIFNNIEVINKYVKKINEIFLRKDYIKSLKDSIIGKTEPYSFNEMTAYEIFKREENFKSFLINKVHDDSVFGEVISRPDGFKMEKLPLGEDVQIVHMNQDGRFFCIEEATNKPVLSHTINLSWMPIYVYKGILNHMKKNHQKPKQEFAPNSKTLANISVPLKQKLKFWRKKLKKKFKK